jgi:hypothetical protein
LQPSAKISSAKGIVKRKLAFDQEQERNRGSISLWLFRSYTNAFIIRSHMLISISSIVVSSSLTIFHISSCRSIYSLPNMFLIGAETALV